MQKRLEIELTVLERQDLTYCPNVLGSRLWQSLFSFSKSRLCQHLFLLWRNWRALLFITLPHKEVRSWTTFCLFTHNQLLSIFRFFQLCVYFAVFLCIASPSALVRGRPATCLASLDNPTDGAVSSELYSVSSHPGKMRLEGPTLPGSGWSASCGSLMCPPRSLSLFVIPSLLFIPFI